MSERQVFLTRDQVKQLTGTANKERQAECLRDNRIAFTLDVFKRPVVTVAAVEGRRDDSLEKPEDGDYLPSWLKAA